MQHQQLIATPRICLSETHRLLLVSSLLLFYFCSYILLSRLLFSWVGGHCEAPVTNLIIATNHTPIPKAMIADMKAANR